MKKVLLLMLAMLLMIGTLSGCGKADDSDANVSTESPVQADSSQDPSGEDQAKNAGKESEDTLVLRNLLPITYDRPENPDPEQLSIVRYVLSNTPENNIHKMRGEEDNVVYVNPDGREAVYDKDGNLVTNSYNQGSYNFYPADEEPIKHFIADTAPWLLWGNTEDDPTSSEERLYYYTLDLDYGIQTYIFFGSNEELEEVSFKDLTEQEKEVYYIFLHLLFNDDYKIQLSSENMKQLQDDGDYYFEYLAQIQEALKLK